MGQAKAWPARVTLDVPTEIDKALAEAKFDDGVGKNARVRALASLWQRETRLRSQAVARQRQLAVAPGETAWVRLTVDMSPETHDALLAAKTEDKIPNAVRLRALLSLWSTDVKLQAKVVAVARDLAREFGS